MMVTINVMASRNRHTSLLGTYRPGGPLFVGGEGSHLITGEGERYLDFTSGIAVNALGYGDPELSDAIRDAVDTGLLHASNLFHTRPAEQLADWLVDRSFADRVFFCNSGAEANEGAIKFARRWARECGGAEKHEIVALRGGFHGRTMGTLALTDRPSYREPFLPLMPGVRITDSADIEAVARVTSPERTAAIIIEPIQGEGGVVPFTREYLRELRLLCDRNRALLIFDEVQVGLGRTGTLWAHESAGVTPDVMTLAKPLAGGLPMGAVLVTEEVAGAVQPGDHATTFGGGPLVATAALAVCRKIGMPAFLSDVRRKGQWLAERLGALALRREEVKAVRGIGLIWGLEIDGPAGDVVSRAMERKLLLCTAGSSVVRIVPPLTISYPELEAGLQRLEGAL